MRTPRRRGPAAPECWACGAVCPAGTRTASAGWARREITIRAMALVELYCGECFARWGWPPAIDGAAPDESDGRAA